MAHPLEEIINAAEGFLVIGNSEDGRFPATSFAAYVRADKRFYTLDLGGLTESRGPVKGERVYTSVADLPDERGDLAVLWVKPGQAKEAVDLARQAGCSRIWFSFHTGHRDAVAHARDQGLEVVEIGRCPVHYMTDQPFGCRAHTLLLKTTGAYGRPPQLDEHAERRELY